MIKLQIDGQFLDMNEKTALNISINSPFFSTDTIAGSTVYDFTIPFSDRNNLIFGFSNIETIRTVKQSFPVHIYHNGSPYKEGVLYIKTISNAFNCYISMDAGLLKEAIADKDLSDLPLDPLKIDDVKIDAAYPFVTLRASQGVRRDPFYTLLISRTNGTDFYSNKYKIKNTFSIPPTGDQSIPVVYFLAKFKELINNSGYIGRFSTNVNYREGSKFVRIGTSLTGQPIYSPTVFENKFFWILKNGERQLVRVNKPDSADGIRFQQTEATLFPSWVSQNGYITEITDNFESNDPSFNGIDEEAGWYKNIPNIRASIVGEPVFPVEPIDPGADPVAWEEYLEALEAATLIYETCTDIKIEDLSNANPHHLSIDSDFGYIRELGGALGWQVIESYTEPIIEGFDPSKIAARLKETIYKTYPDEKFVVAPVRNATFLDDSDFEFYQNNIDADSDLILNSNTTGTRNRNVFTAFPYNNYVLEEIFKLSGLKLYGGLLTNTELATVCLWNNFSNDMVLVDEIDPTNQLRVPSTVIDLRQNLKGTSIKNFLYANRKTFGVDFFYRSNGSVECIFKKAVALSADAEDWSSKEIPEVEIFIEDEINGFSFLPSSDTDGYYSSVVKSEDTYQIAEDVDTLAILEALQNDPVNTIRGVLSDLEGINIKLYRCTFKSDYKKTWVFHGLKIPSVILGDGQNTVQSEIGVPLMYHADEGAWGDPQLDTENIVFNGDFALGGSGWSHPYGTPVFTGGYAQLTFNDQYIFQTVATVNKGDGIRFKARVYDLTGSYRIETNNGVYIWVGTIDEIIDISIPIYNVNDGPMNLIIQPLGGSVLKITDIELYRIINWPRYNIPRTDSEGRSLFALEEKQPSGLKFMFYRGIIELSSGSVLRQFPNLATTADNLDPSSSSYSLHIEGENNYYEDDAHSNEAKGTYQSFWADWCKMMLSARKVKKRFILTPLDILQLDLSIKKYANGKTYLIQKIDFEIGESETIIATTECWRL